jgi:cytochrome c-type biogenesis protein CcsB
MNIETLVQIEWKSAWAIIVGLAAGAAFYGLTWLDRRKPIYPRLGAIGAGCALLGCVGIFLSRTYQVDPPRLALTSLYEFSVIFAAGIIMLMLLANLKWDLRQIGLPVLVMALVVFAVALRWHQEVQPTVMPALRSAWLTIHIITAMLAYGALAVGAVTGAYALVKYRREAREDPDDDDGEPGDDRPLTADQLDTITYRTIAFAFPWLTALNVTGAIWAQAAWNTYWGWDPKEVWSLITWITYLTYLHVRLVRKWRGRKTSILAVVGFGLVIVTWIGIQWLAQATKLVTSLHLY